MATDNGLPGPSSTHAGSLSAGTDPAGDSSLAGKAEKEKKKKKNKTRDAWISFGGRIVAQVVGAGVTIILGVYFVSRSNEPARDAAPSAVATPPAARSAARNHDIPAIAVLPLQNFSGDPSQEYFADGMTEALIADLAQVKGLRVISRTSSMLYKTQPKPVPQVAQELGVRLIVEGSVVRAGDRVRITAQLIDADRDEHIWARTYDRTLKDVLGLQSEVAAAIVGEVKGVAAAQRSRLQSRKAVDPAGYDLYLRGRHAWNERTPQGFADAATYFEEAIRKDPEFALAHAGLADVYQLSGGAAIAPDAPVKARESAQTALQLDEGLAEAHTSLAGVLHRVDRDTAAAENEFRRALGLNPGYATAHQWYSLLLAEDQRDADARRHAKEAVTLDPLSGTMHQTLGLVHYFGRRFGDAVSELRRALELAPHLPLARDVLGRTLIASGKPKESIVVLEGQAGPRSPDTLVTLGIAHARGGDRQRAASLVQPLLSREPLPIGALARWYVAAGDHARALDLLDRLLAERSGAVPLALADPALDPLRSHPRFQEILRIQRSAPRKRSTSS